MLAVEQNVATRNKATLQQLQKRTKTSGFLEQLEYFAEQVNNVCR